MDGKGGEQKDGMSIKHCVGYSHRRRKIPGYLSM